MRPFHKLLDVRQDVQNGTLDQSAYAASLGDVAGDIDKPAAKEYRNPKLFKEMTYETDHMRQTLNAVRERLQDGKGNGIRQIETSFGGGKTHAMIAMYHKCTEWNATPVAIDGQLLDVSNTIWGEIERQLDGKVDKMAGQTAPSGAKIYDLLHNRDKPVLILIDEIFQYVTNATGEPVGNSDLGDQTIIFMQRLNGQLGSLPKVCLVISLSNRDDVLAESGKTAKIQGGYYTKLRKIVGRHRQFDTVAEYNDISHIIRRRLFKTKEDLITDRAKDIMELCIKEMKDGGSLLEDGVKEYAKRFEDTYPFTPDVIDVLHHRWGTLPTFQRTRSVLRLLSLVVHNLLKSDRSWIAPGDIDLSVPMIQRELLQHTGENTNSAIETDIIGDNARSKNVNGGKRITTAIFMYSFSAKSDSGATLEETKRAAFTKDVTHLVVGDSVSKLLLRCFYLVKTEDHMLRVNIKPNILKMLDTARQNVSDLDLRNAEQKHLDDSIDGGKFYVIIWPDAIESHPIQDRPALQLIICKNDDIEWCAGIVNGTAKSRRINMNGLVFLLPSDGMSLNNVLRRYIGAQTVQASLTKSPEYDIASNRHIINREIKDSKEAIGDAIRRKYSAVYVPDKDGVAKVNDYLFNPATDSGKMLDQLLWDRLEKDEQIATSFGPGKAEKYGDTAEMAYQTLMRTPGLLMPASFDVVWKAFEDAKQIDDGDSTTLAGGGPTDDGPTTNDPVKTPDKPEKTYERMVYTQTVDASDVHTLRSLLLRLDELSLTGVNGNLKLRPDGKYDVRLEMVGSIPDSIVSNIDSRYVETDGGWEE